MSFYALVLPGIAPFSAVLAGVLAAVLGLDVTLALTALIWLAVLGTAATTSAGFRALESSARHSVSARQV
jgi:hypothetical protein